MSSPAVPAPRGLHRAHLVWVIALLAYVMAVAGRAAFGVASVEASDRFGVGGTVLSLFGVVQLGSYAIAQIPAGLLLDRLGPRRMLALGAGVMGLGHVLLALAGGVPTALIARTLTGFGDAAVLISAVRLVASWFPSRQVPLFTQLTSTFGQLGQALAAVPFFALLLSAGWSTSFAVLAGAVFVVVLLVLALVRDEPASAAANGPRSAIPVREALGELLRSRGAWAGFFTHWLTLFTVNAFLYLWGVPYLTVGQGLSSGEVSALLTVTVVLTMLIGPGVGVLTGRFPHRRLRIVWTAVAVIVGIWAVTLAMPQQLSLWQLLPLTAALAIGAGTCSLGFDLARTGVRPELIGTATGFVNVGGFSASLVAVLLIGIVLDLAGGAGGSALTAYRWALGSQAILFAVGAIGLAVTGRRGARARTPEASSSRVQV